MIPSQTSTPDALVVRADWPAEVARRRAEGGSVIEIGLPGEVPAWLVLDSSLIQRVMVDEAGFSKDLRTHWPALRDGQIDPAWGLYPWLAGTTMLTTDGDKHRTLRDAARAAFGSDRLDRLDGHIDVETYHLCNRLAEVADGEIVDLRARFTDPVLVAAICHLLGVSAEHATQLGACASATLDPDLAPEQAIANYADMYAVVGALLADKRAHPGGEDLTTALLAACAAGQLTEQEVADTVVMIIAAGLETTAHLLDHMIVALLTRPDLRAAALHGPFSWAALVQEVVRYQPPLLHMPFRVATADVVLGEVPIAAGEIVLVGLGAAGRDPHIYTRPDDLDLTRRGDQARNLSFGHGPHRCLGEALARRLAVITVSSLTYRFPDMELAVGPDELEQKPSAIVNGHRVLPARLGRHEPSILIAAVIDGPTRRFQRRGTDAQPPVDLVGVPTDLYRTSDPATCRHCPPPPNRETRTTTVYQVTDPAIPWYVAVEIHRCQCGHPIYVQREIPTVVYPLDDVAPLPDRPSARGRTFRLTAIHDDRAATVTAVEIDSGDVCAVCSRVYGRIIYQIIDRQAPAWLDSLGIDHCDHCRTSALSVYASDGYSFTDAATPSVTRPA